MSYNAEISAAATTAQDVLAQIQGMPEDGANLVGPNGTRYVGVFRLANPLEAASVETQMTAHGYVDKSVQVVTITRDQFTAPPYGWRRQNLTQLVPINQQCLVASAEFDDPFFYAFILLCKQPKN